MEFGFIRDLHANPRGSIFFNRTEPVSRPATIKEENKIVIILCDEHFSSAFLSSSLSLSRSLLKLWYKDGL